VTVTLRPCPRYRRNTAGDLLYRKSVLAGEGGWRDRQQHDDGGHGSNVHGYPSTTIRSPFAFSALNRAVPSFLAVGLYLPYRWIAVAACILKLAVKDRKQDRFARLIACHQSFSAH